MWVTPDPRLGLTSRDGWRSWAGHLWVGVVGGRCRSRRFDLVLFAYLILWWVGVAGMAALGGWASPVGGRRRVEGWWSWVAFSFLNILLLNLI
jgi:hypothetical protein